jgi:hypothetical protein
MAAAALWQFDGPADPIDAEDRRAALAGGAARQAVITRQTGQRQSTAMMAAN